jgi:hypothetical protein
MFVLPMWYFSVTSYGNPQVQASPTTLLKSMPPEFTTTASLARPFSKIAINANMFYAYIALELGALLTSWIVIVIVLWRRKAGPVISAYPLIDFAAKTAPSNVPPGVNGIESELKNLTNAENERIRSELSEARMYLRVNPVDSHGSHTVNEKSVVLVTAGRSPGLGVLKYGMAYR